MDRRQFLSLSAMVCLGATRNTSAVTGPNKRDVCDFGIAFITDVHIERGRLAVSKFSRTIAEIDSLKPAFVLDMGDMTSTPTQTRPISIVSSNSKCHFMPVPAIMISLYTTQIRASSLMIASARHTTLLTLAAYTSSHSTAIQSSSARARQSTQSHRPE